MEGGTTLAVWWFSFEKPGEVRMGRFAPYRLYFVIMKGLKNRTFPPFELELCFQRDSDERFHC